MSSLYPQSFLVDRQEHLSYSKAHLFLYVNVLSKDGYFTASASWRSNFGKHETFYTYVYFIKNYLITGFYSMHKIK